MSPNPPSLFFETVCRCIAWEVRLRSLGHPGGALVGEAPEHFAGSGGEPMGGRTDIPVKIYLHP